MAKNFVIPNGKRIASRRRSLGLTQLQFAAKVGFTVRTLQKAEASKSVEQYTLICIAEALSIDVEDIGFCPTAMAREWIELYKFFETEMALKIEHLVHPDVLMVVEGDPSVIPFAGEFFGREGIGQFMQRFFQVFTRPDKTFYNPVFTTNCDDFVVAVGEELIHCEGFRVPVPGRLTLSFEFNNCLICRITDQFDTLGAASYLAEVESERAGESDN